jgi:hypothetical protein
MKLNVYSIFDQAAEAFVTPFFMQNDGLAMRAFQDNVNANDENNISKHPEQFSLYKIGEYDDKVGVIDSYEQPKVVARAIELKNEQTYSLPEIEELFIKYMETDNKVIEMKAGGAK